MPSGAYAYVAASLSPACSGSDSDVQRDSHRSRGNGGERAGCSRERRNRCGGLKQARGPRRYSRGLVADRSVTCRSASSVPGGPTEGQGRRLAVRMLRDSLAVDVERAVEALSSHGELV